MKAYDQQGLAAQKKIDQMINDSEPETNSGNSERPLTSGANASDRDRTPAAPTSISERAFVDRIKKSDRWMIWLTAAIAFTSIVSACIFWRQLNIMQGQLNEMQKSFVTDRAYVFSTFSSNSSAGIAPNISVQFIFTNHGRTPAEMRSIGGKCMYSTDVPQKIVTSPEIPGFTDNEGRLPLGVVVDAGQSVGPFAYVVKVTEAEIMQARIGIGKIFCESIVSYDDVRSASHKTSACFEYNFAIKRWLLYPDKRFNFHT